MSRRIVVVKVGGSLLEWSELPGRLAGLLAGPELGGAVPLLIVGGGAIVEELRRLDRIHGIGEESSHALALQAMELTARVMVRLGRSLGLRLVQSLKGADGCWAAGEVPVLAPRRLLDRGDRVIADALPHTWEATSDSIAARVAVLAGASGLWLVKSVSLPAGFTREDAARVGLVDTHFPVVAAPLPRVDFVNLRSSHEARRFREF